MQPSQSAFPHQKLDAYRASLELVRLAHQLAPRLPKGPRALGGQLTRAAISCTLNLAEGANRSSRAEKRQRFIVARGECGEVAAAVEVAGVLGLASREEVAELLAVASRTAALLSGLIRRLR